MYTILVLCVIAAALWVVGSLARRPGPARRDTVADFSRALSALSPQGRPSGRSRPLGQADPPAGRSPARPAGRR